MEKELQEIIKKNLPEQTVGVLKGELKRIPELEEKIEGYVDRVKQLEKTIGQRDEIIKEKNLCITELNDKLGYYQNVEQREKDVEKRERNALITELTTQLECERDKSGIAKDLMEVVFRNNTVKKTIVTNDCYNESLMSSGVYDNNGNALPQKNTNRNSETTIEQG